MSPCDVGVCVCMHVRVFQVTERPEEGTTVPQHAAAC